MRDAVGFICEAARDVLLSLTLTGVLPALAAWGLCAITGWSL